MKGQHSFFLNAGGRTLACTCFLPEQARGAVLFIPPLVEERKGALPVFVQLARQLAAQGVASAFFDFSGTGDSAGEFEAVAPEAFEADCDALWQWLSATFPLLPRGVLGLRCGALLAARLVMRHTGQVAACVQWAPVAGGTFLRQLLQRRMVNDMVAYGRARDGRAEIEAKWQRGESVDLDGYMVSAAHVKWLRGLAPLSPGSDKTPRLVCSGGHDAKSAGICAQGATDVLDLRFPPFWNTVGHVDLTALIERTAAWLARRLAGDASVAPVTVTPALEHVTCDGEFATLPLGAEQEARAIYDLPQGEPRAGVLFLHGWSGDRTGPHRLFTRFGRQLAQEGVLCLRPDFLGRGLSSGLADEASISGMARVAAQARESLQARLPAGAPILVVAICSGCKVAIALAADAPDLKCMALWSAESMGSLRSSATGLRKTLAMCATYARKLARPETWRKILRGRVQTGMVAKALVKHEARSAEEAHWEDGVLARFRHFDKPLLFVFGGSDPDATGSGSAYRRYCQRHRIPFKTHTIAHAGHSFYSEVWTDELLALTMDFLLV